MTKKKKRIIIGVLAVGCLVIAIWSVMRYQARRELLEQFNSDLAVRFDSIMAITYPLIDGYATAMKDRADSIEVMANRAKTDTERSYMDAFSVLWEKYCRTPQGSKCNAIMEEYEFFKNSSTYTMLTNSGDNRKVESEALQNLTLAGYMLKEPYFLEYDSVIHADKTAKELIVSSLQVIEPYHSNQTNIRAWRTETPNKYMHLFEKYNKKKN